MAEEKLGRNITFPIYNEDGTSFHGLVLRKAVVDSVVMSLGDKITGDVYYKDNTIDVTMKEYIIYKRNPEDENEDAVRYVLVSPPTIVREGMVSDNSELKGMTKYSFVFYHPMYALGNLPFTDVAVTENEERFLSQDKEFSWIGYPDGYIAKLNKNLQGTQWMVEKSSRFPTDKDTQLSGVLTFSKNTIADALKTWYDTWEIPYVIDVIGNGEQGYADGKRFKVVLGLPSNEIHTQEDESTPYIFRMGKGVGLKNNSRTPRNNKIVTRISGYGSESNIPYGYPQIVWQGNQEWDYTLNNASGVQTITVDGKSVQAVSYPIYDGIVGGRKVRLIKHPFTRSTLMPTVYRETVDRKVNPLNPNYNPNGEIIDYYDAVPTEQYPYPNAIDTTAPSYEIHQFEDIKPEMNTSGSGVEIVGAVPLNADLTPADAWDDTMDDDGNYLQSYFRIDLPLLSFDIYACASITEQMSINMRSGACIGCTFNVQVDWEDYKKNFYNSDGVFDPVIHTTSGDGHVRDGEKYPDSSQTQISLIVQKDNETFGTLMPNVYQIPRQGDEFVVLGISLPVEYITGAEQALDDAAKSYMLENNVHYYDYPLKFDEYFLATHTYILSQIKPNAIVHFAFGNMAQPLELYVKQLTIKYGAGVLPQYDITLTDNIEVVLNQIGQVVDDVERLSSVISILRETYSRNVWAELAKKLSKTNNDTAYGHITFDKETTFRNGFGSDNFSSGELGSGYHMGKYGNTNDSYLEIDRLMVRKMAYFIELAIKRLDHVGGSIGVSPADLTISNVEVLDDVYRCYVDLTDGHSTININDWQVGDLARCQTFNVNQATYYWRAVDNVDYQNGYVDLSIEDCDAGSGIPKRGDVLVVVGNKTDATRQNFIEIASTGSSSPSIKIYHGINSYSLDGKDATSFEYDPTTGRMKMVVYGDMYVGNREGTNYIKYDQTNGVQIRANAISMKVTEQGQDVYKDIDEIIEEISQQSDGSFLVWRSETDDEPSASSEPESEWTTDEVRDEHIGDIYLNADGLCWEYKHIDGLGYYWQAVSDAYLISALQKVRTKKRCFTGVYGTNTPTSGEYSKGDMWVKATYADGTISYENEMLVCISDGDWSSFSIADWDLANNYQQRLDTMSEDFQEWREAIESQIDGTAESFVTTSNEDPSLGWDASEYEEHKGDIWVQEDTELSYYWNGAKWMPSSVDLYDLTDKVDGKATVFVTKPYAKRYNVDGSLKDDGYLYRERDIWILESDTVYAGYEKGTIMVATTSSNTSYSASHWVKKDCYTNGMSDEDKQDLLDAGIDIVNGKIIATSDSFKFQNRQGTEVAVFEEVGGKGYLRTDLIHADEIVTNKVVARDAEGRILSVYNGNGNGTIVYYYPDGSKMKEDLFTYTTDSTTGEQVISGMITRYYNPDGTIAWYVNQSGDIEKNLHYYWNSLGEHGVATSPSLSSLASLVRASWSTKVPTASIKKLCQFYSDTYDPNMYAYNGLTCYGNHSGVDPTHTSVVGTEVTGYVSDSTTLEEDAFLDDSDNDVILSGYYFEHFSNGKSDSINYFVATDGTVWNGETHRQVNV